MTVAWNDIREAVIARLAARHPDVIVSGESDESAPAEARCFVRLASAAQARLTGNRYRRTASFELRYAAPGATLEALHGMAELLYDDLERVELPGDGRSLRGDGLGHEVVEGALRFAATYAFDIVRARAEATKMERLEQEALLV
jgi:hypothetical protein